MKTYTIILNENQLETIVKYLADHPYKDVSEPIATLISQKVLQDRKDNKTQENPDGK